MAKERLWANCSQFLFKRATSVIHSWFKWIALNKQTIFLKKTSFSFVFDRCSPFLCPRANCSRRSSLSHSFLKREGSDSLSLLFKKQQLWANRSCRSLQKGERERFTPFAHDKIAKGAICSFSQANCSFAHKKWAIGSKNRWANSQPCMCDHWSYIEDAKATDAVKISEGENRGVSFIDDDMVMMMCRVSKMEWRHDHWWRHDDNDVQSFQYGMSSRSLMTSWWWWCAEFPKWNDVRIIDDMMMMMMCRGLCILRAPGTRTEPRTHPTSACGRPISTPGPGDR